MSNYTKSTNFASKDSLPTGNASKIVKGTEINTEFDNIATAIATKADSTSPTLVTPALGTPSSGVMTNVTGLPLTTGVTGTLPIANGGTGATTLAGAYIATYTGTETLTNKTLTAPTIASANITTALTLTGSAGTSGQALVSAGSGSAPTWSTVSSDTVGFKNRIINGAMVIAQRGTSFTPSANNTDYTLDRWNANRNSVGNYTVSQQGTAGNYSIRLQRNSGDTSTQTIRLRQVIESSNCADLAGLAVSFSATLTAGANYSGGSSFYITIVTGSGIDQGLNGMVTNSWTNFAQQTANFTPTTTPTRVSGTITIPAGTNEIGILITWDPSGTAGANDWVQLTNVQLEKGSTATSFDYRPYGTELQLCQRYFVKLGGNQASETVAISVICYSTSSCQGNVVLPVQMRTTPSISTNLLRYTEGSTIFNLTSASINTGESGVLVANLSFGGGSGMTNYRGGWIETQTSSGYIQASAEL